MSRCVVAVVATILVPLCVVSIGAQQAREAPTPRSSDGHPDLSGVYFPGAEDPDTFQIKGRVSTKFSGPEDKPSYQPWVLEKIRLIGKDVVENPNILGCPPPGAPGFFFKQGQPVRFIQTPKELIVLGQQNTTYRFIHTDGRKHPQPEDVNPLFMGDAIGHWDGDTLIVDTIGVDTHTWVGAGPLFASDAAHYTETFRRPNARTFLYQFTIDDPKVLTKPWTSPVARYTWSPHRELEELYCTNLPDVQDGLIAMPKVPRTSNGADERYFDQQEYEELSRKFNNR
jgi:hypothetical protein